uniref:Uncharacterized protein n=1 Tax=Micrurus lemniscatus lemniscatus TaxID=129467 RepID=A0A2D4JKL1_MICLE
MQTGFSFLFLSSHFILHTTSGHSFMITIESSHNYHNVVKQSSCDQIYNFFCSGHKVNTRVTKRMLQSLNKPISTMELFLPEINAGFQPKCHKLQSYDHGRLQMTINASQFQASKMWSCDCGRRSRWRNFGPGL